MSTDELSLLSLLYSHLGHLSSSHLLPLPDEKSELFSSDEPAALPLYALHAFYMCCWIIDKSLAIQQLHCLSHISCPCTNSSSLPDIYIYRRHI
ncbi:hypothetical protein BJX62DRAFT_197051 [Aspergillus germanicus]